MVSYDDRRVFDALENGLSYTDSATARHLGDCPPLPPTRACLAQQIFNYCHEPQESSAVNELQLKVSPMSNEEWWKLEVPASEDMAAVFSCTLLRTRTS
ncbi:hypothetical protein F4781DRAFT_413927 [Annulohypoxylon bovei var. microspora]|nr:hypothetical protein F4781DRAFT_413927 [Annulohypoxylon bovei var. microspora]